MEREARVGRGSGVKGGSGGEGESGVREWSKRAIVE